MTETLLEVREITKRFGGFVALNQVSLTVARGERLGLIGPNGSGKTTLINCIAGALQTDGGSIHFEGTDISKYAAHQRARMGIARSFQIPRPFHSMSNVQNLIIPLEYAAGDRHSGNVDDEAREILGRVGLKDRTDENSSGLTQVDMRRLELARALAARPTLLIVDEVMAGLAHAEVDEILAILQEINDEGITIVMIEHIMRAVMGFSQRIAVLDAGEKIADGDPDSVVGDPNVERAYLGE